jgi:hypothetical protein
MIPPAHRVADNKNKNDFVVCPSCTGPQLPPLTPSRIAQLSRSKASAQAPGRSCPASHQPGQAEQTPAPTSGGSTADGAAWMPHEHAPGGESLPPDTPPTSERDPDPLRHSETDSRLTGKTFPQVKTGNTLMRAEGQGFEPWMSITTHSGFQDRRPNTPESRLNLRKCHSFQLRQARHSTHVPSCPGTNDRELRVSAAAAANAEGPTKISRAFGLHEHRNLGATRTPVARAPSTPDNECVAADACADSPASQGQGDARLGEGRRP